LGFSRIGQERDLAGEFRPFVEKVGPSTSGMGAEVKI
jgi:hypothetical protein